MSALKNALCIAGLLLAYGIVGRMDYEDAMLMESAAPAVVDPCASAAPSAGPPQASTALIDPSGETAGAAGASDAGS